MPIGNIKIKDIINLNGKFKSYEEIRIQTFGQIDQMNWNSIISAIPKEWKIKLKNTVDMAQLIELIKMDTIYIFRDKKPKQIIKITSKYIYQILVAKKQMPPRAIDKWRDIFPFLENFEWKEIYELPYRIIKEPYLQSFQYKLLNRIINCRDKLLTWKISDSNKCIYCEEIDTIEHHFFDCIQCQIFWNKVLSWSKRNLETSIKPTICDILFGIPIKEENIDTINFINLLGKWYINKTRTQNKPLAFNEFLQILKNKIDMIVYNKNINNIDPRDWEIHLMIML